MQKASGAYKRREPLLFHMQESWWFLHVENPL